MQSYSHGMANMPIPYSGHNNHDSWRLKKSDVVVSKLSNILEHADISELQELHDSEEKLHGLLDKNEEV